MKASQFADRLRAQQRQLQEEIDLVSKLPPELDINTAFKLHGQWHVTLLSPAKTALTLLPPVNQRMRLHSGVMAPEPVEPVEPLNWKQPILAVWGTGSDIRWRTMLPDGTPVNVSAVGPLDLPRGYEWRRPHHSVLMARKLVKPSGLAKSPSQEFDEAWARFMDEQGYRAYQRQFAAVFKVASSNDHMLTPEMLPVPVAATMEVAGETLVIARSGPGPAETVPEGSRLYALPRIGVFWNAFTREEAQTLIDFANQQRRKVNTLGNEWAKAALKKASEALQRFQQTYLATPATSDIDADVLTYWLQKETGLPVTVVVRSDSRYRKPGVHHLWLQCNRHLEDASVDIGEIRNPAGFDFQAPDFYVYEDNAGSF